MPNASRYLRGRFRSKPSPAEALIDWTHPLTRSLKNCWLINEGGGATVRDLVSASQGTLTSAAGPPYVPGRLNGPAISYNGSSQYSEISAAAVTVPPISMLCWFKSTLAQNGSLVVLSQPDASFEFRHQLLVLTTGQVWTYSGNGQTVESAEAVTPVNAPANVWVQTVGVWAASNDRRIYLNGGNKGTQAASVTNPSINTTTLGSRNTTSRGQFLIGQMDHAMIWARALSDAEVLWLYQEPFIFLRPTVPKRTYFFSTTAVSTLYLNSTASGTVATDNTLTTAAPNSETNTTTPTVGGNGWYILFAQGTLGGSVSGTEPAQNDQGFLLDDTSLEGKTIAAGNYAGTLKLATIGGTATADIHLRFAKRSSGGVFTTIADCVLSAQSVTTTAAVFTIPATAGASTAFAIGDKLYVDVLVNVTAIGSANTFKLFQNGGANESVTLPTSSPTPAGGGNRIFGAFSKRANLRLALPFGTRST